MSTTRIVEAFQLEDVGPTMKLAAIYLADNGAPETHDMPVTIHKLARFCCCSKETAVRILDDLVWVGFLDDAQPSDEAGKYTVWFSWFDQPASRGPRRKDVSKEARRYVEERDVICVYCGCQDGPYHIDHILPITRGGSNDVSNLALACAPCNISKRNRTPEEWGGKSDRSFSLERVNEIRGGRV